MDNLVYLGGPITGLTYDGCTEWRDLVRKKVGSHINTISPMRGKQRLKEISQGAAILDCYDYDYLASYKGINTRDYWDVQRCSIVFVNFLGATKVSIGTVMEIAWARAFNKPVICVMEPDNIHKHSMLDFACGYVVPTLEIGIEILNALLSTDTQLAEQQELIDCNHSQPGEILRYVPGGSLWECIKCGNTRPLEVKGINNCKHTNKVLTVGSDFEVVASCRDCGFRVEHNG